ncbi:sigma-70 family RNA polymerase sigma factor family protein [Actinocorallia populi]|uniref:hypothetical protein n=1 Tax=Actinocorallia populi TaxID=2079200 RepID=UPI000D095EDC|nr:hypothetical protein [Actinocorallia populi]
MLAPEVVYLGDGGGIKQAVPRPVVGAGEVARLLAAGIGKVGNAFAFGPAVVNGNPALLVHLDGEFDGVVAVRVEDARITGLYFVRNPEKLSRITSETPLTLR